MYLSYTYLFISQINLFWLFSISFSLVSHFLPWFSSFSNIFENFSNLHFLPPCHLFFYFIIFFSHKIQFAPTLLFSWDCSVFSSPFYYIKFIEVFWNFHFELVQTFITHFFYFSSFQFSRFFFFDSRTRGRWRKLKIWHEYDKVLCLCCHSSCQDGFIRSREKLVNVVFYFFLIIFFDVVIRDNHKFVFLHSNKST